MFQMGGYSALSGMEFVQQYVLNAISLINVNLFLTLRLR